MKIKHISINLAYENETHFNEVLNLIKEILKSQRATINWEQGFNTKDKV